MPITRLASPRSRSTLVVGACFLVASFLLIALSLVPSQWMGERALVAVDGARAVLGMLLLLCWVGWAFGGLLLPREWQQYDLLLTPLLGIAIVIPVSYLLNFVVDMRTATALIVLGAAPVALFRFSRQRRATVWNRELVAPLLGASFLLAMAFVPPLVQGSLGPLAMNGDEEVNYGLSQYLLTYPAGTSMPGPIAPIMSMGRSFYRAEGWGFQYLLSTTSAVSGVAPFDAHLPTISVLLSLGVLAWYVFFRQVMSLSPTWAGIAVALYALNGLPLWFGVYGYGRQVAWMTLLPLAWGSLFLALRAREIRPVVFAGLAVGAMMMPETRLGITSIAVAVLGLGTYWLLADRSLGFALRMCSVGIVAGIASAPALWNLLWGQLISGAAQAMLGSTGMLAGWGIISRFPPVEVALGLEPNELTRMAEPLPSLARLAPLDALMSDSSHYLALAALLMAGIGAVVLLRRMPMSLSIFAGIFLWMALTQVVLNFPYGYFKLFPVAAPLVIGLGMVGVSWFWGSHVGRASVRVSVALKAALILWSVLVTGFLIRNSADSVLFGARGWGISVPPSLVRTVDEMRSTIAPGSRVYVTGASRFPQPRNTVQLRIHPMGMSTEEEQSTIWAQRVHALVALGLAGRNIYGTFDTLEYTGWSNPVSGDGYDYYVLFGDEDPRLRGLDPTDRVVAGDGLALYRTPHAGRATSERIIEERGTLLANASAPFTFRAGSQGITFSPSSTEALGNSSSGCLRLGLVAVAETTVELTVNGDTRSLPLSPGITWYTIPTMELPASAGLEVKGPNPVRVVALRVLPPGAEEWERSGYPILSVETRVERDDLAMELWFVNPKVLGQDGWVGVRTVGPIINDTGTPYVPPPAASLGERGLGLKIPAEGERLLLRFPLSGGSVQQLRNGTEDIQMESYPWLEMGGGTLMLRLHKGHPIVWKAPLAIVDVSGGAVSRLVTYPDPVQLPLWGNGAPDR